MQQMIQFDKQIIELNQCIKIGFTKTAFNNFMQTFDQQWEYIASKLSNLRQFVITPPYISEYKEKGDQASFSLNTTFGCFTCVVNNRKPNCFTVISYKRNNLEIQNYALKYGINFRNPQGICLEFLLPEKGIIFKYLAGIKYDYNNWDCGDTSESFNTILNTLQKNFDVSIVNSDNANEVQKTALDDADRELSRMLSLAEQYSELSSEIEEENAQEIGQIGYHEINALEYDRIDRISYEFIIDAESFDGTVLKSGVQVEIQGKNQELIPGEIIDVDDLEIDAPKISILFNKQVDIDTIPKVGWMTISFSSVNRDVQQDAIDRINNKTAQAKYFKEILGAHKTAGFTHKDTNRIINTLQQGKYPPNDSQIKAIIGGIETKDAFLVMGPPGTGKTTIILEWVKYFVEKEHKRVLISSQNNKAVDNVLARLTDEKNIDMLRIGSEAKMQPEIIPYMFENKLADLREKIDDTTTKKISDLTWIVKLLSAYGNDLNKIWKRERLLIQEINTKIIPLRNAQQSILKNYRDKEARRQSLLKEIDTCKRSVEKYNSRNSLMKFLLKGVNNKNTQLLSQLGEEEQQSRETLQELSKEYKQQSDQCNEFIKMIKSAYKNDIKSAVTEIMDLRDMLLSNQPADHGKIHLFRTMIPDIASMPIPMGKQMSLIIKSIGNSIDHCKEIRDIVNDWKEQAINKQNYALNEIVMETVDVVGATCIGINSQKRFSGLHFDVTIIDEAGQIQIQNALVPMSVSNKLLMLGDFEQIPPSVDKEMLDLCDLNDIDTELLEKSLFEKMYKDLPANNHMMLDTQYRMPAEIADIISNWFYNGKYKSLNSKRNLPGLLPSLSRKPFVIIDTSGDERRYEKKTVDQGTYNEFEADICNELIKYIAQSTYDLDWDETGIISAYKKQVACIREKVEQILGSEPADNIVATLDSFQGQERDLIIYSFTRSSDKGRGERNRIGFLNELRRINVAMSRCKKTLIMIGDMKFLSECESQNKDDNGNYLYEHSEKEFSDFIKEMLKAVDNGSGERLSYNEFKTRIGV